MIFCWESVCAVGRLKIIDVEKIMVLNNKMKDDHILKFDLELLKKLLKKSPFLKISKKYLIF